MFNNLIKKILNKKIEDKPEDKNDAISKLHEKSKKLLKFFEENNQSIKNEILSIKEKFHDLCQTNYDLGMKHLENGNLVDAILRFRIVKKFWPNCYDAYYQLAYCFALKNKKDKAKEILQDLLSRNPNYDPKAMELLAHIENSTQSESLSD